MKDIKDIKDIREDAYYKLYANTTSTSTKQEQTNLTIETLKEIIKNLPKDPIAEYMRSEGFDPDDGCFLLIPESMSYSVGRAHYIKSSKLINKPFMINPNKLGLYNEGILKSWII